MKVLITGGAGFIGTHLGKRLKDKGCDIESFDSYDPQAHPGGKKGDARDVLDYGSLKKALLDCDAVVHFAAAVGVGQSQYQVKHYTDTNVGGTANLLDILANNKHRVKKILVAGSMSAYGEGAYECASCGRVRPVLRTPKVVEGGKWEPACPGCSGPLKPVPTRETDRFICSSIYAVTKMTQEELVMNYGVAYDVPAVSMRFFNVYGPGQTMSNPYTGVAAIFMGRIKNNEPPAIYEDGGQTRDFISVHDIARACAMALESEKANHQIFNVGTGQATSIRDMAERLIRLLGKDLKPEIRNTFRRGDIRHCFADAGHIRERIGFEAGVSLEDGLSELIEWAHGEKAVDGFDKAQKELSKRGLA